MLLAMLSFSFLQLLVLKVAMNIQFSDSSNICIFLLLFLECQILF